MLEKELHEFSCFTTLTYAPEHLPFLNGLPSLSPRDVQLWLKRLRRMLGPARPIRFFLCGEYGEDTYRPHYHAILYGVAELEWDLVNESWGLGGVDNILSKRLGSLTHESAQYVTGYVAKKMTAHDDPRLSGRYPEFARMSNRPGIGAGAVPAVAEALNDEFGARYISENGDVPAALRTGGKLLPLGRYLRRKLRDEMGFDNIGGQELVAQKQAEELRTLSAAAGGIATVLSDKFKKDAVKVLQAEGRSRVWSKRSSL